MLRCFLSLGAAPRISLALLFLGLSLTSCGAELKRLTNGSGARVQACDVGGKLAADVGTEQKDEIVLGCGEVSLLGRFDLVGSRLKGEGLCLSIKPVRGDFNAFTECQGKGSPPKPPKNRDLAIQTGTPYARDHLLTGYTSLRVARVRVAFSVGESRRSVSASLVTVRGRSLERYGSPAAFRFCAFSLPPGADDISAVAFDRQGRAIDRQGLVPA